MKNNSSFTSISKSILLVLCLWFIGISVSNGQGWDKKFDIGLKGNYIIKSFNLSNGRIGNYSIAIFDNNLIEDHFLIIDQNGKIIKNINLGIKDKKNGLFTSINTDFISLNENEESVLVETISNNTLIIKLINNNGQILNQDTLLNSSIGGVDQKYPLIVRRFNNNPESDYVFKIDKSGKLTNKMLMKSNYSLIGVNDGYYNLDENNTISKLDSFNNILWEKSFYSEELLYTSASGLDREENLIIIGIDTSNNFIAWKYDKFGNLLFKNNTNQKSRISTSQNPPFLKIIENNIVMKFEDNLDNGILIFDKNFNLLNKKPLNIEFYRIYDVINDSLDNLYFSGAKNGFSKITKLTKHGTLSTNELQLKFFSDDDKNCIVNSNEKTLKDKLVNITDIDRNDNYFSSNTDTIFAYLDTGKYVIHPIAPIYYKLCADSINIAHNQYYDTIRLDIPLQPVVICPYLEVDISTPILRRCFNNTYSVHYCNQGTAVAKDAYVEVKLDKWLKYVSSTRPLSSQQGNILRYDLGDIPISDCGDFQIITYLDCDSTLLGQTHCTEAHIFPDSLCLPTNGWDGSRIRVSGQCVGDSIRFEIKNASNSPMLQQSEYIVVEDEIIMMQKPFQLGANESLRFNMPVFGRTYRLEAAQSVGHPGSSKPSVTIENCGVGPVSLGFVNQFHQDDADPFIEIDCQQNRGSYDPNDKQGFPTGYGKSHFVEQNQQIEYLIRFQNTGTDTAFTVRIHDTLSTHLDPTSFVGGASSHPYSYRIFDNGIIEFLFSAIALPDSNINKSGSIGFVKFTIAQRKDLPLGTEIKNRAAIYFDYNSPILTNTTIHTIGKNFITITEIPEINTSNLRIYPNPFSQEAVIEWDGNNIDEKVFELYDLQGRQLRKEKFTDNRLNFKRNQLQNGLYFFKITDKNGILTQGEMVVD